MPNVPADLGSTVIENTNGSALNLIEMRMRVGCFGPNLRPVGNPLHPSSTIKTVVQLKRAADATAVADPIIAFEFPAKVIFPEVWAPGETAATIMAKLQFTPLAAPYTIPNTWNKGYQTLGVNEHQIGIFTTIKGPTTVVSANGSITIDPPATEIKSFSLRQAGIALTGTCVSGLCGSDGNLSAYPNKTQEYIHWATGAVQITSTCPATGAFGKCDVTTGWHNYARGTYQVNFVECRNRLTQQVRVIYKTITACTANEEQTPFGTLLASAAASYHASPTVSGDGLLIELAAYFPGAAREAQVWGETGFCGSYFSPLLLFFDGKRPRFTGQSRFPLSGAPRMISWVEPGAPGYFLAWDRDGDGRLTHGGELFGSSEGENGFLALAAHDANGDGVIDARDPIFKKLLLWSDANGDGATTAGELSDLKAKRVRAIGLSYRGDRLRTIPGRAQIRQEGKFTFRDAAGKDREGTVLDVWFEMASPDSFVQVPGPVAVPAIGPAY